MRTRQEVTTKKKFSFKNRQRCPLRTGTAQRCLEFDLPGYPNPCLDMETAQSLTFQYKFKGSLRQFIWVPLR